MNQTIARLLTQRLIAASATVCLAATSVAGSTAAQDRNTPKNWNWEIRDGKKVPKGNITKNADGSRREVIRQGSCLTVKEWSASGEYRETRECTPKAAD